MSRTGLIGWFAGISLLSLASRLQMHDEPAGSCSLDGAPLVPALQVDLVDGGSARARFCSIDCALLWPDVPPAARFEVRDEITGRPLDATRACFVAGRIPSTDARDRIHAFENPADAAGFCSQFGGGPIASPFARAPAGQSHK